MVHKLKLVTAKQAIWVSFP